MEGVMSTPITRPLGATFLAAIRLSKPAPHPTSTTNSPGRSSPRLKGLPVPAKDSTQDLGMPSSHSSRYSSMRAKGRPVWKWKPFCGWLATSAYSSWIAWRRVPKSRAGSPLRTSLISAHLSWQDEMVGLPSPVQRRDYQPCQLANAIIVASTRYRTHPANELTLLWLGRYLGAARCIGGLELPRTPIPRRW